MTESPVQTKDVSLTCQTSGCMNEGIAIALTIPVDCSDAICGVCSQPIAIVVV
jgi:hypothetical protein